jgi:hypothetical protein
LRAGDEVLAIRSDTADAAALFTRPEAASLPET